MLNLLKIEWLKVRKYRAFILLSAAFIVGVFATNYVVYLVSSKIVNNVKGAAMVAFSPYEFSKTWQSTSYTTSFILILPAMLILILLTNEYGFKTHRQNIIDGWTRREFIGVKLMVAFLIALASTLLVFICALIMGLVSGTDFSFEGIEYVGYFFLKALSYNFIAVLFSVLVKRTGFAIGAFFIYLGVENIVSQLLDLLSIQIKSDNGTDLGNIGDYLPMNAADGLLSFPNNTIKSLTQAFMPTDYRWLVLCFAIAYLLLFYWWARKKFINTDL